MLGLAGPPDRPPPTPPIQLADVAGGALFGAVGILAALYERERGGRGQQVDVSMCEGALAFAHPGPRQLDAAGTPPRRGGELLNGGAASYGMYRTKDGRFLSVGALEPKFWAAFNAAIGRPVDYAELVADAAGQDQVRAEIQAILEAKTRDEWEAILVEPAQGGQAAKDVCVEPVLAIDELARHPQHRARGMFFEVDGLLQTRTPFGSADGHRPPPALGGDGAAILRDAGFSDGEIAELRASAVTK